MGGLTKETVVAVPAERVFSYVVDPHNAPRYISSITSILSGPEGTQKQGDTWRADVNFLGRRATVLLRLAELQMGHLVKFAIEDELHATLTLRLAPRTDVGHTAISLRLEVPSVPDLFLNALMSNLLSGDMTRLKNILESGSKT